MADSPYAPISLGRWDPYRRTLSVSLRGGSIRFLPGRGTQGQFEVKDAAFPAGARLEYRVQKGDMYFDGDHSQALGRTLWVIGPDGSKSLLASGFVLYMSLTVAARNLKERGIPFRAVSFYEAKDGQVVEKEITIPRSGARFALGLALASSNLWLGLIAGLFVHAAAYLVAIGIIPFSLLAIATLRTAANRKSALVNIFSAAPTYAAVYIFAIVLVRFVFRA